MAWPQGAGMLADTTACKALEPNCSSSQTFQFYPSVHPTAPMLDCISKPNNILDPLSFLSFPFLPFRSVALAEGCQEEAPQIALQCLWETIHYPHGFSPFPVCSAGKLKKELPVRKETTLLVAHSSLSVAPVGSIP